LRRGAIANWCEHVLADDIRHFSLEKILLDCVFLDESFFERINGGVSSDALPNRQSSIGRHLIGLSHAVVDWPTPAEYHPDYC
jgi:hypothetical protein